MNSKVEKLIALFKDQSISIEEKRTVAVKILESTGVIHKITNSSIDTDSDFYKHELSLIRAVKKQRDELIGRLARKDIMISKLENIVKSLENVNDLNEAQIEKQKEKIEQLKSILALIVGIFITLLILIKLVKL